MLRGKCKSLTLIEVMVAVSISVVLLGVSIPIFSKNAKTQELTNEAETISAFYSRARNFAFHPERVDVAEYAVSGENCVSGACNQLAIYAVPKTGERVQVDNLLMPNVMIKAPESVAFSVGDGKVDISGTERITIYFKGNDENKINMEINSVGNIDVIQED